VIRLGVRVRREDAELVLAELLELAPGGVEEVDLGEVVEYAVYGAPGELPDLPDVRAAAGDALVEVSTSEVGDDWAERWREFHRPLVLGDRLAVRPPWEPPQDAEIDIVIDPGQAFGTGAHATTRLCLELLLELPKGPGPFGPLLDLGCGSGVLAVAAAKLGFAPVLAVDHDPLAVQATAENAAVNGVEIEVARIDLRSDPLPAASTVLANLLRPLLLTYAERMTEPPERLIVSGLLDDEVDEVTRAFARHGLRQERQSRRDAWNAALLMRWSWSGSTGRALLGHVGVDEAPGAPQGAAPFISIPIAESIARRLVEQQRHLEEGLPAAGPSLDQMKVHKLLSHRAVSIGDSGVNSG
jgi:ribosomal protein L11 methyltransferase